MTASEAPLTKLTLGMKTQYSAAWKDTIQSCAELLLIINMSVILNIDELGAHYVLGQQEEILTPRIQTRALPRVHEGTEPRILLKLEREKSYM